MFKFLCNEDKEFYNLQKTSGGSIGYISSKTSVVKLHPSQIERMQTKTDDRYEIEHILSTEENTEDVP
ncbi:hypothetical protein A3Q56_07771 [Intoshia linei]|uniref:Uncharacterized protein n=1 Tax=Intoshia linei TaxID=1819745 RepID=A0A177AT06_9BILA|nr:hypothetical protein A3Q56_07771 [Intoshia linei]